MCEVTLWARRQGTRLAVIPYRWPRIPKYPPRFLMSPMRLFPFSEGPLRGGGGSFGVFRKCFLVILAHVTTAAIARSVSCEWHLGHDAVPPETLRWLRVSPQPQIFRKQSFLGALSSPACLSLLRFHFASPPFLSTPIGPPTSLPLLQSLLSWDPNMLCTLLPG